MPTDERRLHPSSLLIHLVGHARGLVLPAFLVLVLASGDTLELWLAVLIVPSMLFEAWRYFGFRYRFEPDALVLRQGFVFRSQRHVPLDRVQSIDLVRSPLARIFGVAEVRIETASGEEPEAHLKFVSLAQVDELRARLLRPRADAGDVTDGGEPATAEPAEAPLLKLQPRDLLVLGLDLGRGVAIALLALGLARELDLFERFELGQRVDAAFEALEPSGIALQLGLAALAVIVLVFLLSLAWNALRLAGFELRRSGEGFRLSCGLFTRLEATIPRRRIQLVSVRESFFLRRLKRASVRVELASGGIEVEREAAASKRWFAPLVRRSALGALLREIDPALDLEQLEWRPLGPRGRARMQRRALAIGFVLAAPCFLAGPRVGAAATLVLPLASVLLARGEARFLAHARTASGIAFRSGCLTRKWSATWTDRVQGVALLESPFDRRHGMATLAIDTAGAGPAAHPFALPYLPRAEAAALLDELARASDLGDP